VDRREAVRLWVEIWKAAGPELEAIRRKEIREADDLQVLASLEGGFQPRGPNHAAAGIFRNGGDAEVVR
jgi:hypothetical protein